MTNYIEKIDKHLLAALRDDAAEIFEATIEHISDYDENNKEALPWLIKFKIKYVNLLIADYNCLKKYYDELDAALNMSYKSLVDAETYFNYKENLIKLTKKAYNNFINNIRYLRYLYRY